MTQLSDGHVCHTHRRMGQKRLPEDSGHRTVQPHGEAWQATHFSRTTSSLGRSFQTWITVKLGVRMHVEKLACPQALRSSRVVLWLTGCLMCSKAAKNICSSSIRCGAKNDDLTLKVNSCSDVRGSKHLRGITNICPSIESKLSRLLFTR